MKRTWVIAMLIGVVTLAVYWPVTRFQFVNLDDPAFISNNPHVQAGLTVEGFKWAWSSVVVCNWHPITMLSFMLDCQLFGAKPWWPHLVNALLHAANAVLLFGLLKRMTGALWRSAVVAALFALHPLHVESVAWVSERKDVLSTLFWFLTIWAYVRYTRNLKSPLSNFTFYGLSLLFCALGLMSKPMLVTLPFTLLLLDYWPLGRKPAWGLIWEKIPYFAMSAAVSVVTFRIQTGSGGAVPIPGQLSLGWRMGNALTSYLCYVGKMFWPRHLAAIYPLRLVSSPWWETTATALALAALCWLAVWQRHRRPYLAFGWFWYIGTLVPVIGLVQVGNQAMADRYTYVPLIGLFIMISWGGWEMAEGWRLGKLAATAAAGALALCAGLTVHQETYWKDSETCNKRMIEVTPDNANARSNLGLYYLEMNQTDEALSNLQVAIKAPLVFAEAHNNLGMALEKKGRIDEAIQEYQEAIRLKPALAEAHNNLGEALARKGQRDESIRQYEEANRLNPDHAEQYNDLGNVLVRQGRFKEAVSQFQECLRLNPNHGEAHYNLAMALQKEGRLDEAIGEFRAAIHGKPGDANIHNNLGTVLNQKGQAQEAIGQFREAIGLKPEYADAHYNLALALLGQGQLDEAIRELRQAIGLKVERAEAHNILGAMLGQKGQFEEAIGEFREAIRLEPANYGAHFNLGRAYWSAERTNEAAGEFRETLRLRPGLEEAQKMLGALEGKK